MIGVRRLRHVAGLLGTILKWYGTIFFIPLVFAVGYGSPLSPFVLPLVVSTAAGYGLERRFPETDLARTDGFLLVVLTWIAVSLVGALPYLLSGVGTLATPINALFESVSGFSCTGSTVVGEISLDKYPHALMLWRQLTQWLGGMGILVLAVAVLPRLSVGGAQFLDNEVPGPRLDRLTPHMAETARRLWILYVAASGLLFVLLFALHLGGLAPKMDAFQALAHALTTLPSGGFSPQARSIAAFSPAVQWVIVPFMLVAAMNFALLWRALLVRPRALGENAEFKAYLGLLGLGTVLVCAMLGLHGEYAAAEETIRHGVFQTATILTTTGYATADFTAWPGDALLVMIVLMFVSGSVGSTSGGLKILRWMIAVKVVYREVVQRIHPSSIRPLRVGERVLKEDVVRGALVLIVVYLTLFAVSSIVVAVDTRLAGLEIEIVEILSAVAVTLGNIGPGLGRVGPMGNFEFLPVVSKGWMCVLMIAGRLEIMSLLVLMTPRYWRD